MKVIQIDTATPNPPEQSILIIYTGGTLGMVYSSNQGGLVPFDFEQILDKIPELRHFAMQLTLYSLEPLIDSSDITPNHWIQIANIIKENYQNYDGFVVLHGTDTMAFSASALSFLLEGLNKPVIFTGAQLPIGAVRSDARTNLLTSIEIAAAKRKGIPLVPEVAICFHDLLLRGNRAKKLESAHFDAFHSENYPSLATIGTHIEYNHKAILTHTATAKLQVHPVMESDVAILKMFPGVSKSAVESITQIENLKGLVIETYGSGNAPTQSWFVDLLKQAINRGIFILNISQCIGGQVMQGRYATSAQLLDIGVLGGSDLTLEAGITKMMYLLGKKLPAKEFKKGLIEPICGELTTI
ncbi:L-asparaginase 1 [marine bacterium AO1-C]|nr:L-asparaginase 1 [marine bacterium AO1-C]